MNDFVVVRSHDFQNKLYFKFVRITSIAFRPVLIPFVPNARVLCPLKTSENLAVVEKGCIGNKWAKDLNPFRPI